MARITIKLRPSSTATAKAAAPKMSVKASLHHHYGHDPVKHTHVRHNLKAHKAKAHAATEHHKSLKASGASPEKLARAKARANKANVKHLVYRRKARNGEV